MSRAVTLWGWGVLAGAAAAYQVAGWLLRRTPTLGQAVRRLLLIRAARLPVLAAWLWFGWHTFVRSSFH